MVYADAAATARIVALFPMNGATPAFIIEQASSKLVCIRHQEELEQSYCQHEGKVHYTLHLSMQYM